MIWIASVVPAFVAAVAVHAIVVRRVPRGTSVLKFICSAVLAGAAWVTTIWLRHGWTEATLPALLIYAFAVELYLFLFTLVGNSVAVSLLITIVSGAMAPADLAAAYPPAGMVRRRLDQLERAGLVARAGGQVALSPKGRVLLTRFEAAARWIRGPVLS